MKTLFALTAALALAACADRTEEEPLNEVEETGTTAQAPSPAANQTGTGDMAGQYEVTFADGTMMTETIYPDGTYMDLLNGEETRGRWRMDGKRSCFDPHGAAPEECYTSSAAGADGSFTVTGADGEKATVRKVGESPAPNE